MTRVVSKERCPRCAKRGADRSADNLAVYDDGHKYCYGCGYYGHPPNSLLNMAKKLYKNKVSDDKPYDFDVDNISWALPREALRWLNKYGVTEKERLENKIFYDYSKDLLILPVFEGERLCVTNGRYFGDNPEYPKYVTKGWKTQHFKHFPANNKTFVLTEDYISALRVGRQYNAIPLLGTHCPNELILNLLSKADLICVWLDPDKSGDSIKIANRISQWKPAVAIISDKDPKDYTDDEINTFIQSRTQG